MNARRFMDFYTANGWKVGKVPMNDWKAAVRSWESNGMDQRTSPAPARESDSRETFLALMERARMEEAKEI